MTVRELIQKLLLSTKLDDEVRLLLDTEGCCLKLNVIDTISDNDSVSIIVKFAD